VKLRQYAGEGRVYVEVDTHAEPWRSSGRPGVSQKLLYAEPRFPDSTRLLRFAAGAAPGGEGYVAGAEIFVIEGVLEDEYGAHPAGSWLRLPPGAEHRPHAPDGAILYVKSGGLVSLRQG
jgi:hypothetical protein